MHFLIETIFSVIVVIFSWKNLVRGRFMCRIGHCFISLSCWCCCAHGMVGRISTLSFVVFAKAWGSNNLLQNHLEWLLKRQVPELHPTLTESLLFLLGICILTSISGNCSVYCGSITYCSRAMFFQRRGTYCKVVQGIQKTILELFS